MTFLRKKFGYNNDYSPERIQKRFDRLKTEYKGKLVVEDFEGDDFDRKIPINSYVEMARLYSGYMKRLRVANGMNKNDALKQIITLFKPIDKIEQLVIQVDTSQYHKPNVDLQNEMIKYGSLIEDFIGWMKGLIQHKKNIFSDFMTDRDYDDIEAEEYDNKRDD